MNEEFDSYTYNTLMAQAKTYHNNRDYVAATDLAVQAYQIAPDYSAEQARSARDIGARWDRRDDPVRALEWSTRAYEINDYLLESYPYSPNNHRDRGVSAMYLGVLGLRNTISKELDDSQEDVEQRNVVLGLFRQTWTDIKNAKQLRPLGINRWVDQYEINAARRVSMAESHMGNKARGLALGLIAVGLAPLSESPLLSTGDPDMTTVDRLRAKSKALQGGIAALGVAALCVARPRLAKRVIMKVI